MDRARGRGRRQDLSFRQAAREHAAVGLLQRRPARRWSQLADPVPGAVDVSEMTLRCARRLQTTFVHPGGNCDVQPVEVKRSFTTKTTLETEKETRHVTQIDVFYTGVSRCDRVRQPAADSRPDAADRDADR